MLIRNAILQPKSSLIAKEFSDSFTESVYSGTINEDGLDPSGYMRPKNDLCRNNDAVIVEYSYNLTDTEIDALRNAISEEFLNHQGWITDNYGRVKENGIQIYKAGYVAAIQKVLKGI